GAARTFAVRAASLAVVRTAGADEAVVRRIRLRVTVVAPHVVEAEVVGRDAVVVAHVASGEIGTPARGREAIETERHRGYLLVHPRLTVERDGVGERDV